MDGVTDDGGVVSNTGDDGVEVVIDGGGVGGDEFEESCDGAALRELMKGVVVGEESYKTPKKGFSSVAISVEIEEYVEVEVGLPPPSIGMVFQSWQKLDEYFREYGKQNGFGVVRTSACKVGKGANAKMRRNCLWTCECFGLPNRKRRKVEDKLVTDAQIVEDEVVGVKRRSKKVQCPVNVYANVNERGEWVVQRAHMKHVGHTPTPGKAKNISRLRKKFLVENPHVVRQLFNERRCGVPVAKIYNKMARERNGLENMPFAQKDLHEEVAKQKKKIFEESDAKAMFTYFQSMVEDNPNFFNTYRVVEEGRLKDVLWVDVRCRMAYEEFGDVVCFESTYLTNEYKLPFCNFVGVNHHGQTILFGCALVSRDTAETFEWVFSNWLRCMENKTPVAILTDQDPSMRKALKTTMKGLHTDGVDIEWVLSGMSGFYLIPAFVKHLFWAGMKTTQRVESIHSFFDGYLSRHTLLSEFVERYCEALEVRAISEKRADDNNSRFVRQPMTAFPAESVFRKI
ncbi:protein FAR-RED IMPAIRED RESPONSE 1-like [Chenopodium quinoa]|uniref:protein FAR-RED IMPAIRED RESPONSE 1-like n=1 Tax=Chenopodium quinoa TaxID=63459 RepID=UPI000B786AD1|nr:protein FAR-RED IMPAIRED RESPONSE 1-like [Chenopodium quinoa]